MSKTLVDQTPLTRCYHCGEPEVQYVCHHCGRPMCAKHKAEDTSWFPRLVNSEFKNPAFKLNRSRQRATHCEDCQHATCHPLYWATLLIAEAIIVGWLVIQRPSQSLLAATLGLLIGFIGYLLWGCWQRRRRFSNTLTAVPLLPFCERLEIAETLRGHIQFDATDGYTAEVEKAEGAIVAHLQWTEADRERCRDYLDQLQGPIPAHFHAGFLLLQGRPNLTWAGDCSFQSLEYGRTLALTQRIDHHPFLSGEDPRQYRSETARMPPPHIIGDMPQPNMWPVSCTYDISLSPEMPMPVRVIPFFKTQTANRELVLEIQWDLSKFKHQALKFEKIDSLQIYLPASLKEGLKPTPVTSPTLERSAGSGAQPQQLSIRWVEIWPSSKEHAASRLHFSIRFLQKIPSGTILTGTLQCRLQGCISKLETVSFHDPLGYVRTEIAPTLYTTIRVAFSLHLDALYREHEHTPPESHTLNFEHITPNNQFLIMLLEAINERGYHIKQVTEHPPHVSRSGAYIRHRLWNVTGRKYTEGNPIHFHLVIKGQEIGEVAGRTQIEVTVHSLSTVQYEHVQQSFQELTQTIKNLGP